MTALSIDRPRRVPCPLLWSIVIGFFLVLLLATLWGLDLALARYYYEGNRGWFLQNRQPWESLYRYGNYPALGLAITASLGWLGSSLRPRWHSYRRPCLIIVCAVALGPGVVVNGLLKPYWGRPRPRQVVALGGELAYREWWQPGGPGSGRSFPSGHAAMGYVLLVGSAVLPPTTARWLRVLLGMGALGYGTLLGWGRIVQGGHFLCDVVTSGGLTTLTIVCLQVYFPPLSRSSTQSC